MTPNHKYTTWPNNDFETEDEWRDFQYKTLVDEIVKDIMDDCDIDNAVEGKYETAQRLCGIDEFDRSKVAEMIINVLRDILLREPPLQQERKGEIEKALQSIKKAELKFDLNIEVTLKQILESNGIKDAIWCLRAFECLFLADIAESVYPIYKKYNPHDTVIWNCIQSINSYYHGFITKQQLYNDAGGAAADASAVVYTANDNAARAAKWKEIEEIFKQHFCE